MSENMEVEEARKRLRGAEQGDPEAEREGTEGGEEGGATAIVVTPDKDTDYTQVGGRGLAGVRKNKAGERSPGVQFKGISASNRGKGGKGGGKGAARAREDQQRTSEVADRARAAAAWERHPQAPRTPIWNKLGVTMKKISEHCEANPTVDPITALEEALGDRVQDPRINTTHVSRGSRLESTWGDMVEGEREITFFNAGAALSWTNRHDVWPIAAEGYTATVGPTDASPQEIVEFLQYADSMLGELLGEKNTSHILLQGSLAPRIEWAGERARHTHLAFISPEAAVAFLHLSVTWIPLRCLPTGGDYFRDGDLALPRVRIFDERRLQSATAGGDRRRVVAFSCNFIGRDVGQFAGFCHTFNRKNRDVLESVEKGRKRDVQADFLDRNSIVLTFTTEIVANNKVASGEIGFPLPAGTHLKKLADNETLAGVQDGP